MQIFQEDAAIPRGRKSKMEYPCPECGSKVAVPDDCMEEETLECPECAVELQIISKSPLSLVLYEEAEK
ncbi:MAG: hypothetical protein FJX76_09110 [Armatimonadetes bacterium]|nr:hypothetical protein [Armatimonadota bacterium]